MIHLFEMYVSSGGDNLVKSGSSVGQLALSSYLDRTMIVIPNHLSANLITKHRAQATRRFADISVLQREYDRTSLLPAENG
jgi:hypothetical protein